MICEVADKLIFVYSAGILAENIVIEVFNHAIVRRPVLQNSLLVDAEVHAHSWLTNHLPHHLLQNRYNSKHETQRSSQVFVRDGDKGLHLRSDHSMKHFGLLLIAALALNTSQEYQSVYRDQICLALQV